MSAPLSSALAPWPGDPTLTRDLLLSHAAGDGMDLTVLHLGAHLGTHADAPRHVRAGAPTLDQLPLEPFLGPCQVLHVPLPPGSRLGPEHLPTTLQATRILFRTDSHPDPTRFPDAFVALSRSLVEVLADRGVVLVGLDTPSVDPLEDASLEAHQALVDRGICWLEGMRLSHVAPGCYGLSALPLNVVGGDGAPVRAVLWTEQEAGPS